MENAVFLALRRRGRAVAYTSEPNSWECDFVTDAEAIQVCKELTEENREREIRGALRGSALPGKSRKALVLTLDQRDEMTVDGTRVEIRPVWEWMN